MGAVARNRCQRHQQAKTQTRHKQQHENAPIKQSTKQSGNQAISKPQQQLASQYRNQSVGRMARRKKLTTSPVELWQVGTPCSQEPTQLTDRPTNKTANQLTIQPTNYRMHSYLCCQDTACVLSRLDTSNACQGYRTREQGTKETFSACRDCLGCLLLRLALEVITTPVA